MPRRADSSLDVHFHYFLRLAAFDYAFRLFAADAAALMIFIISYCAFFADSHHAAAAAARYHAAISHFAFSKRQFSTLIIAIFSLFDERH
jgi:hypothetical protein